MRNRIFIFTVLAVLIGFSLVGSADEYEYQVQQVRFQYDDNETYEQDLSGVNIVLSDETETLTAVSIGRIGSVPEGTVTAINIYLYRQQGDLWDKDGWSEWDFLNGETVAITNGSVPQITIKLQWNGLSFDVVSPAIG